MRERALIAFADVRKARREAPDPPPPRALARALAFPVGESWRQRSYGDLLRSINLPDEAARAFRRSLALDPDQLDARFNLGFVYWSLNQREQAIAEWKEVLRRDPTDVRVQQVLSRATGGK
jgi:predicted Zn-dependent protease